VTDRAQFTTPRLVPALFVGVAVLAVVAAELRDRVAAVDGPVAYCGLCHVDWTPVATLLIIAALVGVISLVTRSGVAPSVFRGGGDE
jgi:hypothetical protein